jgi:Fe-S-cluster containining protein
MADSIRGSLPPSYKHLFNTFFDRPKVVETRATCERCAMCNHGDPSPVTMEYFDSSTKCCTFWPALPNYLVGAILADETPEMAEGKRRIRNAIAKRVGVTPWQMARPRKMSLLMQGYADVFGRARSLKCPYYDDNNPEGTCSIWRHREVICMTYYCKYSGGMRGYDYWNALKEYLGHVQRILSKNAATVVDRKVVEPQFKKNILTLEEMEDLPPKDSDYAAWWGPWVGREEDFYLRCHEWVSNVSPAEFAKNVDESEVGKQVLSDLVAKYELLESKILPKSLVRNARMRETHVGDKVVVTSYHRYDPFSLDKDLFEVVGLFKADQTLEENLERLKRDEGIELAPELIEYLFVAGVLVEPKAKAAEAKEATAENTGERSGRRAALRAILEARGLSSDEAANAKIDAGDIAKLDLWIKKAAVAKTVADVLSD